MILSLLVIIPILTILALMMCKGMKQVRMTAAIGMGIEMLYSIYLLFAYLAEREVNSDEFLFMADYTWFESLNIHYLIGLDGISVVMILLTGIVTFTGVMASWKVEHLSKEFFISLVLLASGVFGFFISLDLFTMFLFYEVAVIPMYLLIGLWGTGKKEYSAMKLTLMLMGGSALLLVGILAIYFNSDPTGAGQYTFNMIELAKNTIPLDIQRFIFPLVFIGFGALGALFPFHTWSPDGHASAPTAVSMLHAGVLMKLGGYGCLRVAIYLLPEAAQEMSTFFLVLTGISVIYGALGAVVQTDLKYINAYSSVSHLGLVLFAVLMLNKTSFNGAILQSISHGLMTALFFALIGMIYGRTHTRDIRKMAGLMKVMPFLAVCYVIAGMASLGLPGLSGFAAEMTIFVGAFEHADIFHRIVTIVAVSSIVVTAVYILRVVGKILLGPVENKDHLKLTDAEWHEKLTTVILILAVAGMGIAPYWLADVINESMEPIWMKVSTVIQ